MNPQSGNKLIYFTASYPYGLGETWKSNELRFLANYFKEITVLPFSYGGNYNSPKTLIDGVKAVKPLFSTDDIPISKFSIFKLLDKNIFYYLNEFFVKRVYTSKYKIVSWLKASLKLKSLLRHPVIRQIINNPDKNVALCFFWGKGSCDFLPFIDKDKFGKIVVRFHRYDLFEDQNNGYIPYRRQLLKSIDIAAPSSQKGYDHLHSLYPNIKTEIRVLRLGVMEEGRVKMSADNVLRVMSCSYVIPVKRVHLIAEALKLLTIPVEWTHVGNGAKMDDIMQITSSFAPNIKFNFPGMIDSNRLMEFYKKQQIDLFINVSSSEGIPMSILECLSAGIPVFATNVGGTGEIIDDSVGKILPPDITPAGLASSLLGYYELAEHEKLSFRNNAYERYKEKCDAKLLTNQLAEILIA